MYGERCLDRWVASKRYQLVLPDGVNVNLKREAPGNAVIQVHPEAKCETEEGDVMFRDCDENWPGNLSAESEEERCSWPEASPKSEYPVWQ